jgi:hypothetical protein
MRYLNYILLTILVAITAGLIINNHISPAERDKKESCVLEINSYKFTEQDIQNWIKTHPYAAQTRQEGIKRMIDTELVLQEAYRQRIDKEKEFREYVQDFVNQSLVTILLKRQEASLEIDVSPAEIKNYLNKAEKLYDLELFTCANLDEAKGSDMHKKENLQGRYGELPFIIRKMIDKTKQGELSEPFFWREGYARIKVIKITNGQGAGKSSIAPEKIKRKLYNQKKQYAMEKWLHELKQKAHIRFVDNTMTNRGTRGGKHD